LGELNVSFGINKVNSGPSSRNNISKSEHDSDSEVEEEGESENDHENDNENENENEPDQEVGSPVNASNNVRHFTSFFSLCV